MALKKASEQSNLEYLDLDALAKEGAAVVITHRGFGEEKDYGQGEVKPIRARVIVLTGTEAGRVEEDALIFKAGIRIKLGEKGDDVYGRLGVYGARKAVGLEAEQPGDAELAEKALAAADAPEDEPAAKAPAAKKKPAAVPEPAPAAEGDDSDPDF